MRILITGFVVFVIWCFISARLKAMMPKDILIWLAQLNSTRLLDLKGLR